MLFILASETEAFDVLHCCAGGSSADRAHCNFQSWERGSLPGASAFLLFALGPRIHRRTSPATNVFSVQLHLRSTTS